KCLVQPAPARGLDGLNPRHPANRVGSRGVAVGCDQVKSNLSLFITLAHAAAKSLTNFSLASAWAYTSATARSTECEPNTRSLAVAVPVALPEARSTPS